MVGAIGRPTIDKVAVSATSNATSTLEVEFAVRAETDLGSCVRVVGSAQSLGSWTTGRGLDLCTTEKTYPRWATRIRLPRDLLDGRDIEYKFTIVRKDGGVIWEDGPNRRLTPMAWKVAVAHSPDDTPRFRQTHGQDAVPITPAVNGSSCEFTLQDEVPITPAVNGSSCEFTFEDEVPIEFYKPIQINYETKNN